tara:strand:+ start:285 stop:632 length:348 start_codon:yes stop_codon:yes gene_type:complete
MNKVLIVGHSPAKKNVLKSPTMKKLHRWLDECCIDTYAFTNLCPEPKQKLTQLDTHVPDTLGHDKIIALGGEVSKFLKKIGVAHFAAPHPSPLNRKLNDISFEKKFIQDLKAYVA